MLWINSQGRLLLSNGNAKATGSSNSSVRSSSTVTAGAWVFVTLVVDCIDGVVEMYTNGRPAGKLFLKSGDSTESTTNCWDGAWSLGEQFTLFGTKAPDACQGGALRCAFLLLSSLLC